MQSVHRIFEKSTFDAAGGNMKTVRGRRRTFVPAPSIELWSNTDVEDCGRLRAVIEAELREHRVTGAAVGLLRRDEVILVKGFGTTDPVTGSLVTPSTIFQTGSVSKLLTAVVVLILAEEGRIDLHAPIGLYATGLDANLAALTMHQLLTHTAGLKDAGSLYGARNDGALKEKLADWGPEFLFTTAGEVFSYSNPGYSLAGLVIECVTGLSFVDAMRERLFAPLGMHSSRVGARVDVDSAFSAGHVMERGRQKPIVVLLSDNVEYRPAGYIFSSLQDLCRLLMAILNGGMLENDQVLPPTILERVAAMHVTFPGTGDRGYGYGLYVDHSGNRHIAGHTGFNAGFGARICLCVDARRAIIVLTNHQAQSLPQTTKAAMKMLCAATHAPRHATRRRSMPAALTLMSEYAGVYAQHHAELIVRAETKVLWLRSGVTEVVLRRAGKDRFAYLIPGCPSPIEVVFTHRQAHGFQYLHTQSHAFRRCGRGVLTRV
jgi:CubicO group peptidase (beta-lactamase class C family)